MVIDLGVLGHTDDAASDVGRPPPARRWPGLIGAIVLVGLFAAGSLPVAPIESIAGMPGRTLGFAADAENLYALREEPSITAYSWRDGQPRWTRMLAPNEGQLYFASGRPFIRHRPCTQATGWSLERLDPRTGQQRWMRPGGPLTVLGSGPVSLLMVEEPSAACPLVRPPLSAVQVTQQPPMRLTALDADTGDTRWSFVLRSGRVVVPERRGGGWFAIWYGDGRAEVRAADTGTVSATAVLPELADGPPQSVRIIGELLVIVRTGLDGAIITAYHRDGLALAWRSLFETHQPAPIAEIAYGPAVVGCGPMVCVPTWHQVTVLDTRTGAVLWRRDVQLGDTGSGVLLARDRDGGPHTRVLDWRTGRDVVDLAGWDPVPMIGEEAVSELALVQRPDGASARLTAIDLRTGQLRPLGAISPIPSRCAMHGSRLGCLAGGDAVHLWRLPR
jgi:hypothetical protein